MPKKFCGPVAIIGYLIAAAFIGYAVYRTNRSLNERMIPMMGVLAAFIFAAQMLNFPVFAGTTGHFLGGALAAIILGPWAAILVMSAVVGIQALLFQDGGLVVMGVNLVNMAILTSLTGYAVYLVFKRMGADFRFLLVGGFVASWISVVIPAVAATVELAISGTSPFAVAFPAMVGFHALIGIGEGLITVGALSFIKASRPELLGISAQPQYGTEVSR